MLNRPCVGVWVHIAQTNDFKPNALLVMYRLRRCEHQGRLQRLLYFTLRTLIILRTIGNNGKSLLKHVLINHSQIIMIPGFGEKVDTGTCSSEQTREQMIQVKSVWSFY